MGRLFFGRVVGAQANVGQVVKVSQCQVLSSCARAKFVFALQAMGRDTCRRLQAFSCVICWNPIACRGMCDLPNGKEVVERRINNVSHHVFVLVLMIPFSQASKGESESTHTQIPPYILHIPLRSSS